MSDASSDLKRLSPDQFLLWWFENSEAHGLSEKYKMYYSHYFEVRDRIPYVWKHIAYRLRHLSNMDLANKRLLDIGCGLGTELLWAAMRGAAATGIELHKDSLAIARARAEILKRHANVEIALRELNVLDLEGEFDIILLRETFHHLEPREDIVAKISHLLAKNGVLIIEETNGYNPLIQLKYLHVRGRNVVITKVREDGVRYAFGNERITTPRNLDRLFAPHGIVGKTEFFRLLPTALAERRLLAHVFSYVEMRMHNSIWLRPFYLHYSWIGKRVNQEKRGLA